MGNFASCDYLLNLEKISLFSWPDKATNALFFYVCLVFVLNSFLIKITFFPWVLTGAVMRGGKLITYYITLILKWLSKQFLLSNRWLTSLSSTRSLDKPIKCRTSLLTWKTNASPNQKAYITFRFTRGYKIFPAPFSALAEFLCCRFTINSIL